MPSKGKIENMKDGMEYGQLILTTSEIKDSEYCIAKAVDSRKQVHKATGKASKIVFEKLPVGEELLVYVAGINARGQGEWSNGVPYIISPLTADPPKQLMNNS